MPSYHLGQKKVKGLKTFLDRRRRGAEEDEDYDENVRGLLQKMAKVKRERKITHHGDEDIISATGEYFIPLGSPIFIP